MLLVIPPHDLPILEAVGNPFVLGKNQNLQRIGRNRGWSVITNESLVIKTVEEQIEKLFSGEK